MSAAATTQREAYEVEPARLASGAWSDKHNRMIGEGDISASYSPDRIAEGKPIRKPFDWQGQSWVCVGRSASRGIASAYAYRLVHPDAFPGEPCSYADKVVDSSAARADPNGFYHGMSVRHGRQTLVLCGPEVVLVAGEKRQLSLF